MESELVKILKAGKTSARVLQYNFIQRRLQAVSRQAENRLSPRTTFVRVQGVSLLPYRDFAADFLDSEVGFVPVCKHRDSHNQDIGG